MMEFPCGWTRTPVLFVLYKRLLRGDKIHFVLSLSVRPLPLSVPFNSTKHSVYLNIPFSFRFKELRVWHCLRHWEHGTLRHREHGTFWSCALESGIGFRKKTCNWQIKLGPSGPSAVSNLGVCSSSPEKTIPVTILVEFSKSLGKYKLSKFSCI
jgi:hypothetical protein